MDTSNFCIQTRSRGIIQDDRADPSSSTPNAYQTDHRRHDGQFVKPTTPEQLEEIVLTRIAAVAPAARSRSPVNFFDTSHGSDDLNVPREDQQFHRQVMPKEVPLTAYRNTTLVSCDILKANKLTEYGHDNLKRKELILKVLRTEDLLTTVTKKRQRPRCSEFNLSGYSARKMLTDDNGDHVISADDESMYTHDFARLYVAINIATSESLQFLFPEATTFGNRIPLWELILAKIFGTTYKDAPDAADKLRRWGLDPSKHIQHDLHHLVLLVKSQRNFEVHPTRVYLGYHL